MTFDSSPLVTQPVAQPVAAPLEPLVPPPVAETWHTVVLLVILALWATSGYFGTHSAKPNQPPSKIFTYLITAGWEWLVVGYIAWGVKRHGGRFRDILGRRWNKFTDFLLDFAIAVGFWYFALVVLLFVALALQLKQRQQGISELLPQTSLEIGLWVLLAVTAGFCEETIFRGYLQKQFVAWTRHVPVAVVLSAILFGAAHIYGGFKSAILVGVLGLLFGILAEFRRSLIPGMITHAWQDTFAGLALHFLGKYLPKNF